MLRATVFCLCLATVLASTTVDKEARLVGGTDALTGEYPYIVSVQRFLLLRANHVCGGTILNNFHVLSAAQCFFYNQNARYRVQAGKVALNQRELGEQTIGVLDFEIHPMYEGGISQFDLAVVRLQSPFGYNNVIQPINLPVSNSIPDGVVRFAGWGSTTLGLLPIMSNVLQQQRVAVFPNGMCSFLFHEDPEFSPITPGHVCLGPVTGGIGSCLGDQGGPVVQVTEGQHTLVGVISWNTPICGAAGMPSVTVRASAHIEWITEVLNPIIPEPFP